MRNTGATHSNQPQLAMWRVVVQSCAQMCGTNIAQGIYIYFETNIYLYI